MLKMTSGESQAGSAGTGHTALRAAGFSSPGMEIPQLPWPNGSSAPSQNKKIHLLYLHFAEVISGDAKTSKHLLRHMIFLKFPYFIS